MPFPKATGLREDNCLLHLMDTCALKTWKLQPQRLVKIIFSNKYKWLYFNISAQGVPTENAWLYTIIPLCPEAPASLPTNLFLMKRKIIFQCFHREGISFLSRFFVDVYIVKSASFNIYYISPYGNVNETGWLQWIARKYLPNT